MTTTMTTKMSCECSHVKSHRERATTPSYVLVLKYLCHTRFFHGNPNPDFIDQCLKGTPAEERDVTLHYAL
jgi:hypothetical protein